MKSLHVLACILSLSALGTQSAAAAITAPDVPAGLRPPPGQVLSTEALATGVQIYECAVKPGAAAGYEWVFRSPEAVLADRSGQTIGKHYAGPTWESNDGSTVAGEVASRDPGPSASAQRDAATCRAAWRTVLFLDAARAPDARGGRSARD